MAQKTTIEGKQNLQNLMISVFIFEKSDFSLGSGSVWTKL
jgi:hypothetical protein